MSDKPYAAASARNSAPILGALRHELRNCSTVLEIGSGTGQHAVAFAAALQHLTWQTSDLEQSHDAIRRWLADADLPNVLEPIVLDVLTGSVVANAYDAVYSANTTHIMSYSAVCRMFELVAITLREHGVFCLYGPFCRGGVFNTESNATFDASLRARNATMGIRDLDDLAAKASQGGLLLERIYAMPANNLLTVWTKSGGNRR